jgi:hypothetical protein
MMLAGIKTGKKKKQRKDGEANDTVEGESQKLARRTNNKERCESYDEPKQPSSTARSESHSATAASNNQSMADQLRAQLASGKSFQPAAPALDNLEQRGRIGAALPSSLQRAAPASIVDFTNPHYYSNDADLTIAQMAQNEKQTARMSLEELEARNVLRTQKHKRRRQIAMDSDDDDAQHQQQQQQLYETSSTKAASRHANRAFANYQQHDQRIAKCWWWLESPQFHRQRLLALGNHVSLIMPPLNSSLIHGQHFYLVPLQHVESLVAAEDDVWDEIQRFQTSLSQVFKPQGLELICFETVLPTKSFWQTRLECIAIPRTHWVDAPLCIRQALLEQAQDEGTHQKIMETSSATKSLRSSVPKNFAYIYIEYDTTQQHQGYVQIIESASDFPKDFAVDTVAGMIQQDPLRLRRRPRPGDKKNAADVERTVILQFLEQWKAFDWTLQLDDS